MNVGQQLDAMLGRGAQLEVISTTGAVTGRAYDVVIINATAKFTQLKDETGQDLLTPVVSGGLGTLTSATVFNTGMIIAANKGRRIETIQLNQGSVLAYTYQGVTITPAV